MNTKNTTELVTPAIREYTQRQNVALMALNGLLYNTHNDLSKYPTVKDINQAFGDILYGIGSIYEVLLDNIQGFVKWNTLDGLEDYAKTNNVALMALDSTIKREAELKEQTVHEDGLMALELLLYDIRSINSMLSNNMDFLWEIKDKSTFGVGY